MNLVGRDILEKAKHRHGDTLKQLRAWEDEVKKASWKSSIDIKNHYSSASFLANNTVIFNIKGNRYRLLTRVNYSAGIVLVRWFGTHPEYDQMRF